MRRERTLLEGRAQCIVDFFVRVAANRGAPRADVVDVLVFIDVPAVRALDAIEDNRFAADRLERPHRRADATRHQTLRLVEDLAGLRRVVGRSGRRHPH